MRALVCGLLPSISARCICLLGSRVHHVFGVERQRCRLRKDTVDFLFPFEIPRHVSNA